MSDLVPWRRLWRRLDGDTQDAPSGDGFLGNWEDIFGIRSPNDPQSLDELLDFRCLILCGEPGMGKSRALELHRGQIEEKACCAGMLYWRGFRESIDADHLLRDLKSSAAWTRWAAGECELTVVIDGIDEGLMFAPQFVEVLTRELRDTPTERVRLILACRDAEWPVREGRSLMELWPAAQVGRFQLQRLRPTDADQAARHWGLSESDALSFMAAVEIRGIEAFAARPITLEMLVEEFKATRELSGTRGEIFRRACLRLCREDPQRAKIAKKATGFHFTDRELLQVAMQIAAWTLLGRFNVVSVVPPVRLPPYHLDLELLVGDKAEAKQRARLEAAIGGALFCDAGSQAWAFSHQSYAEFLAAEYLANFPLAQLLDLLTIHEGGERFVVPQLAELAAWLALRNDSFLDWLIGHEPEILLRNDASVLAEDRRARIVGELLVRMAREEAFDEWGLKRFYESLLHPGLPAQIRPYLKEKKESWVVRRAAIHLAAVSKLAELFDDLLAIAADTAEDIDLRGEAMQAILQVVPKNRLGELEKFARCEVGNDTYDQLRGIALELLVPQHWSVTQALPAILHPGNHNLAGRFFSICRKYLPGSITLAELPTLLSDLSKVEHPFFDKNNVRPLACRALVLAAENLDQPPVAGALVYFLRTLLRKQQLPWVPNDEQWEDSIRQQPNARRSLAKALVEAQEMSVTELRLLKQHQFLPLKMDDFPWLLERLEVAGGTQRSFWVFLIAPLFSEVVAGPHRDLFFEACERLPDLASAVGWPCVTELNSQEAEWGRQGLEWQRQSEEQAKAKKVMPTAAEVFENCLAASLADWQKWPELALELQKSEVNENGGSISLDPTKKHRWSVATPAQREQIIKCARDFLRASRPASETIHGEFRLVVFWALVLVRTRVPIDEELRIVINARWFDALCTEPFSNSSADQDLTSLAAMLDSKHAAVVLRERLEKALSQNSSVFNVLLGFELAWKPEFTQVLLDFLQTRAITGLPVRNAIEFLARQDPAPAQSWLDQELMRTDHGDRATVLALALGVFPKGCWARAKSALMTDTNLSTSVLQILADIHESFIQKPLDQLMAEQLSDLFLLLETAFPSKEPFSLLDPDFSPRERLEKLRLFIPDRLQILATKESCRELLRLADAVPHWRTRLRLSWRTAHRGFLRKAWSGVPVDIVASMVAKRESRWVRSADDLLELVLESLQRFQHELNETDFPMVRDLWNEKPLRPKEEIVLTQKLVRWFRDDLGKKNGVVLGCQVEPSSIHETDIEVWAVPSGASPTGEKFVVTLEVKSSFNQEVATSLEKQLASEYLLKLGRTHGLYVVGWYSARGWAAPRNPLKANTWNDAQAAVRSLLVASRSLHPQLRLETACLNCEFPEAFRKRSKSTRNTDSSAPQTPLG